MAARRAEAVDRHPSDGPSRTLRHLLRRLLRRTQPGEAALRKSILAAGGSLRPSRPAPVWHDWVNRPLRSHAEVELAHVTVRTAGLAPHPDRPKNWDALVALGTILERVPPRAAILDMGAATYSPLLRWLYAYGYRSLVGIDLVYEHPATKGPIRFLPMDLTATSFPDASFQAIACLSVIEHGVDVEAYFREASRLLAPGGVLVTSTDYWPSPLETRGQEAYGHPVHVFDRDEVKGLLAAGARHGLRPIVPVDLDADEQVVRWGRMDLEYTFMVVVLVRQADGA